MNQHPVSNQGNASLEDKGGFNEVSHNFKLSLFLGFLKSVVKHKWLIIFFSLSLVSSIIFSLVFIASIMSIEEVSRVSISAVAATALMAILFGATLGGGVTAFLMSFCKVVYSVILLSVPRFRESKGKSVSHLATSFMINFLIFGFMAILVFLLSQV